MSVPDSAAKTLDVLRREGWSKCFFHPSRPEPHCMHGAMARAGLSGPERNALHAALDAVIAAEFPYRDLGYLPRGATRIIPFNDHPSTTWEEVEGLFEKVIAG